MFHKDNAIISEYAPPVEVNKPSDAPPAITETAVAGEVQEHPEEAPSGNEVAESKTTSSAEKEEASTQVSETSNAPVEKSDVTVVRPS
ncbi:unnamed protein product [Dibothriocephalus latus]|uniref:Uncharacterized protein n=1 Tax=Dibothriocephalus latus TaxID=60516 RepID=A0A3P7NGQ5_DIBLA|nr:unnamed protein product [Dibothriocephalus latus]